MESVPFLLPEFANNLADTNTNIYFSPLKAMVGVRVTGTNIPRAVGKGLT